MFEYVILSRLLHIVFKHTNHHVITNLQCVIFISHTVIVWEMIPGQRVCVSSTQYWKWTARDFAAGVNAVVHWQFMIILCIDSLFVQCFDTVAVGEQGHPVCTNVALAVPNGFQENTGGLSLTWSNLKNTGGLSLTWSNLKNTGGLSLT